MYKRIREEVKQAIIAQGGRLYGFNVNNIKNALGCDTVAIQNAINYYQFSPQQKTFRETYNFY